MLKARWITPFYIRHFVRIISARAFHPMLQHHHDLNPSLTIHRDIVVWPNAIELCRDRIRIRAHLANFNPIPFTHIVRQFKWRGQNVGRITGRPKHPKCACFRRSTALQSDQAHWIAQTTSDHFRQAMIHAVIDIKIVALSQLHLHHQGAGGCHQRAPRFTK
jgi:hypothetical protein